MSSLEADEVLFAYIAVGPSRSEPGVDLNGQRHKTACLLREQVIARG